MLIGIKSVSLNFQYQVSLCLLILSSAILVSFLHFICKANISLTLDEAASVWMPAKACHDFIMILLCLSTIRFYSSCIQR